MKLQQSTALRPFVQQLVILASIARWTGNDQIRRVIRAASTQGYHVVDVVCFSAFTKFHLAIIAASFLPLESVDNIKRRINALGASLRCTPAMLLSACYCLSIICAEMSLIPIQANVSRMFRMLMSLAICSLFFSVDSIVLPIVCQALLVMFSAIPLSTHPQSFTVSLSICKYPISMSLSIPFSVSKALILVGSIVLSISLVIFLYVSIAIGSVISEYPIFVRFIMPLTFCLYLFLVVTGVLLLAINDLLSMLLIISSTLRPYLIFMFLMIAPILFIAFSVAFLLALLWGVVLGYSILHGRTSNVLSSPGVLAHCLDTPFLPHHCSINPPVAQIQGVML